MFFQFSFLPSLSFFALFLLLLSVLASPACLTSGLHVLLALNSFFNESLETNYLRIYRTDFHDFSPSGMYSTVDVTLFFRSLKGRCHGNQFLSQIGYPVFIRHTDIPKGIGGSQFRFKNIKCRWSSYILWKFGELQSSKPCDRLLERYSKNWHVSSNISKCTGPIFAKFSRLVDMSVGMINLTFV